MEPIYTVLIIIIVIWVGIFGYMFHLDREVKKISEKLDSFKTKKSDNK